MYNEMYISFDILYPNKESLGYALLGGGNIHGFKCVSDRYR